MRQETPVPLFNLNIDWEICSAVLYPMSHRSTNFLWLHSVHLLISNINGSLWKCQSQQHNVPAASTCYSWQLQFNPPILRLTPDPLKDTPHIHHSILISVSSKSSYLLCIHGPSVTSIHHSTSHLNKNQHFQSLFPSKSVAWLELIFHACLKI